MNLYFNLGFETPVSHDRRMSLEQNPILANF